jgi:hypothetical protein
MKIVPTRKPKGISPGMLFKAKVRFYGHANLFPGEIFMYIESEISNNSRAWEQYRHKFLSGDGRVIWWYWKYDIQSFMKYMNATDQNYIERIEL